MNSFLLYLAVLVTFAGTLTTASAEETSRWNGTSTITFSGSSTLHDWSGKVTPEPFLAYVTTGAGGRPVRLKAEVQVQAAKMDTAEPKRDSNMRKAMQVASFPLVTAEMDAPFSEIAADGTPSRLPFDLALLGKSQRVNGVISNWILMDDSATFDLDFDLSLKKCGITVPSVLLVIRVGDTIRLHASVKLVRNKA